MYEYRQKVMFEHCDPAGIVFYPRYFQMLNWVTESWFDECLGHPFSEVLGPMAGGVPTAKIEAEFLAPSRMGDVLSYGLRLNRLGTSSAGLGFVATSGGELRLRASSVIVFVDGRTGRPAAWPGALRAALDEELEPEPKEDGDA
jgi:4-hydroxybenzoyl-CoA thioesterase